ncbi:MYND finger [Trypanosoma vivax]|uniref:MYND-type domain-containing protein n=1 Tax=Trypanosoma vivax (strain Y486) TaxID=1055687 RepID=G0TUW1_TRYVY|nr:hypothetical protein TRVL_08123 [Trypanosoma vivax]KAH8610909.1 MYND finger [Trypanosoma vivax]CCC47748.1 conserved hypothetical protein [Trypanosoma vivax Y486]
MDNGPHELTEVCEDTINHATVLRYPFQAIDLGWLVEYIDTCLSREERRAAALRILNDFMAFAVLHDDPFLEEATIQLSETMSSKFTDSWPKCARGTTASYDVARCVFELIRSASKCQKMSLGERNEFINNCEKHLKRIENALDSASNIAGKKKACEVLAAALSQVHELRRTPDSCDALGGLLAQLKALFFCYSPCISVYSMFCKANANGTSSYVCSESCPCFAKLKSMYTLFIRDVEKMKVIDCLLMMAVKEEDKFVSRLAEDLFTRFDCRSPFLEKPVRRIQNGALFAARVALFDAYRHVKSMLTDCRASSSSLTPLMENVVLALYIIRREMKDIKGLNEQVAPVEHALATADTAFLRLGSEKAEQHLRTLNGYIVTIFTFLSAPEFHLAVHSRDNRADVAGGKMCGNPKCANDAKNVATCGGCHATSYCGIPCRDEHWEEHKSFCAEMRSRMATPAEIKMADAPIRVLKPVGFK